MVTGSNTSISVLAAGTPKQAFVQNGPENLLDPLLSRSSPLPFVSTGSHAFSLLPGVQESGRVHLIGRPRVLQVLAMCPPRYL